jgi:organic hydroperoxide reductase OsmC/OhrA
VKADEGRLAGEAVGEVELEGKVLVIKRIHVRLRLRGREEDRAVAERVHGFFAEGCPVYRSLKAAIFITTELAFEPAG